MAETSGEPRRIPRRALFALAGGAGAIAAEKTGLLKRAEKTLGAVALVVGDALTPDPKPESEMPPLNYDVVEYFKGQVTIDVNSGLHVRPEPGLNNYPIPWNRIKYLGAVKMDRRIKQVVVEDPRFVPGMPTDRSKPNESDKYFVLDAVVAVLNDKTGRYKEEPSWVYINRSKNTEEYVHFPSQNPEFAKGYLDDNRNYIQPKVTVKNR
jgi:hypothetical protein